MARKWMILAVDLMICCGVLQAAPATPVEQIFDDLPFGCFVTQSDEISAEQTKEIAGRLGTPIDRLTNTYLRIHGTPI